MAIDETVAVKEATEAFGKSCEGGKAPDAVENLIKIIVNAVLKQVKAGVVETSNKGTGCPADCKGTGTIK